MELTKCSLRNQRRARRALWRKVALCCLFGFALGEHFFFFHSPESNTLGAVLNITRISRKHMGVYLGVMGKQDGVDFALRAIRHAVDVAGIAETGPMLPMFPRS